MNQWISTPKLPNNMGAEQAVLGAVFLDNSSLAKATQYLEPHDFYNKANRMIYYTMLQLSSNNQPIDSVTLPNLLRQKHQLQHCGGYKYVSQLACSVPTASNIGYYAKIVKDKSLSRDLIKAGNAIAKSGYTQKGNVNQRLNQAESRVLNIYQKSSDTGLVRVNRVINNVFKRVDQLTKNNNDVTGIPTGYSAIDKVTTGLQKGELMVVAARPSMGKTTFALNVAQNVAKHTGKTVAFFSAEMNSDSIVERMICAGGHVNSHDFQTGNISDEEMRNAAASMGRLSNTNIYIDDTPDINISALMARSKRLAKESQNLGLIVVDYLQLVEGNDKESRQQEVSEVSRQLKKLAKSLQVPVLALAQLSRSVEQRENKRPVLSDIRESGSIEQDADIVAFLYRKDYYVQQKDSNKKLTDKEKKKRLRKKRAINKIGDPSITEFIISKNRSGPRADIKLIFLKAYNKFSTILVHSKNEPPKRKNEADN